MTAALPLPLRLSARSAGIYSDHRLVLPVGGNFQLPLAIPSRLGYYLHMSDTLTAIVRQILRNTSISQDAEFRFMQAVKYVRVVHGTKLQSAIDFVKEVRAA